MAGTASATGDPHFTTFAGGKFDFHGTPGKSYLLLKHEQLKVVGRLKEFMDSKTVLDQVTITTDAHTAVASNEHVLVEGKPPLERLRRPGDWIWCRKGEDRLVAVGHAGWLVSVFRDSGQEAHHFGGELEGVRHCGVFIEVPGSEPGVVTKFAGLPEGATGLLVDGSEDCDPGLFEE